jgi:hypothetical protein
MRFLFRLGVLALAAVGAKSLYERFAPKAAELRGPAGNVLDTAKTAARDVTKHAKDAASEVADDARQRAADVRGQASDVAEQAQGGGQGSASDAPTLATPAMTTPPTSTPV